MPQALRNNAANTHWHLSAIMQSCPEISAMELTTRALSLTYILALSRRAR
jgi:hypothetical protein